MKQQGALLATGAYSAYVSISHRRSSRSSILHLTAAASVLQCVHPSFFFLVACTVACGPTIHVRRTMCPHTAVLEGQCERRGCERMCMCAGLWFSCRTNINDLPTPKTRPAWVIIIVMSSSFFCMIERFEPSSTPAYVPAHKHTHTHTHTHTHRDIHTTRTHAHAHIPK